MKYSQITVSTTSEASELVAYFLEEVCQDGVSISDPKDLLTASWDYADDNLLNSYGKEVLVKGYCKKENTESVLCFLREKFAAIDPSISGSLKVSVDEVDGDAWIESWKSGFTPIDVGNIIICPEWLSTEKSGKKVLTLENGASFGTGRHETTRMCLTLMQEESLQGKTVLDVGCGSGILGLSALLLGAEYAVLTDIDEQATEVARRNAEINNLTCCKIVNCSLASGIEGVFDVVFANLTAEILYTFAEDAPRLVAPSSTVILSGILCDRADKVADVFTKKGFTVTEILRDGEWCAMKLCVTSKCGGSI